MKSKQYFLGLNWKMNPSSPAEVGKLITGYQDSISVTFPGEIVAFVPDVFLDQAKMEAQKKKVFIELGAQDISTESTTGAYTGQISAHMLMAKHIPYVLIGHSEKRSYHNESNHDVAVKIAHAYEKKLQPVVCFGDNGVDGDYSQMNKKILKEQLTAIFSENLKAIQKSGIIVAYEPIWAIGTGVNADSEYIQTVLLYIKKTIHEIGGESVLSVTRILYGGSVNDSNIAEYAKIPQVDGFLIGGASLKPDVIHSMILSIVD